jgi:hypothetical protein
MCRVANGPRIIFAIQQKAKSQSSAFTTRLGSEYSLFGLHSGPAYKLPAVVSLVRRLIGWLDRGYS